MTVKCAVEGCGGTAVPTQKDGRFYPHRGNVFINVPRSFVIPKCNRCDMDMLTDELLAALTEVLEVEYQVHAAMIRTITKKYEKTA